RPAEAAAARPAHRSGPSRRRAAGRRGAAQPRDEGRLRPFRLRRARGRGRSLPRDPAAPMTAQLLRTASQLIGQGRAAEALRLTTPAAEAPDASAHALSAHAAALKALDRLPEAADFNRRAVERNPADRIGWHNLAATLGDLSDYAGAREAARRAFALGLDAPETWLVLGRALQGLTEFDEAEQAFREA